MEYYISVIRDNYANFEGRARRAEYWNFFLFNILISFGLGFVGGLLGLTIGAEVEILSTLYGLAVLIPGIAVGVRRLHDTNRSGWWLLIALIPLIGVIILIVFLATEGNSGPNQYGPDPKNPSDSYLEDHLVE